MARHRSTPLRPPRFRSQSYGPIQAATVYIRQRRNRLNDGLSDVAGMADAILCEVSGGVTLEDGSYILLE